MNVQHYNEVSNAVTKRERESEKEKKIVWRCKLRKVEPNEKIGESTNTKKMYPRQRKIFEMKKRKRYKTVNCCESFDECEMKRTAFV